MATDSRIQALIEIPKTIVRRVPARGFRDVDGHKRCDVELNAAAENGAKFSVFIRQNREFIDNFSIGLRCQVNMPPPKTVTLVRYNGPHGETSRSPDGHYALPHIHRITERELASGSFEPQERHRAITDRYRTLEEALSVFFRDIGAANYGDHFPELLQMRFPDGH